MNLKAEYIYSYATIRPCAQIQMTQGSGYIPSSHIGWSKWEIAGMVLGFLACPPAFIFMFCVTYFASRR